MTRTELNAAASVANSSAAGMLEYPALAPSRTAVVIVDMVQHQTNPGQGCVPELAQLGMDTTYYQQRVRQQVIPNTRRLASAARAAGAQVVFLRLGAASERMDEVTPHFQPVLQAWGAWDGTEACAVIPELAPETGDVTLLKGGSGGFTTSALDTELRQRGIEHVLYTGVVTHACVLLTLAAGFDLGYYGYLVSDATAAFSPRLHDATEDLVSGFLARVVTTSSMLVQLDSGSEQQG